MAIPYEMMLYPELLTNEQLICIIQQRQLKVDNIERKSRDDLLELFRNFCVPYGQRKYRDTGRGKVLNRTRHSSPDPPPKLNLMTHNKGETQLKRERLKPPPEQLSGQMKRIKLDNNAVDTINNSKRKMSIDTPSEVSPPKKERKLITWP